MAVYIMCTMFTYHTSEQCKWFFSYFSIALHKYHSSNQHSQQSIV